MASFHYVITVEGPDLITAFTNLQYLLGYCFFAKKRKAPVRRPHYEKKIGDFYSAYNFYLLHKIIFPNNFGFGIMSTLFMFVFYIL